MRSTGGEALANGFINKSLPDIDDRLFGRPQIAMINNNGYDEGFLVVLNKSHTVDVICLFGRPQIH